MIFSIRAPRAAAALRPAASIPGGLRIYAIGDIHGRADLLGKMADLMGEDLRTRPVQKAIAVTLGDYIDRGPASAAVIGRLAGGDFPTPLITLMGNHEDLFQKLLRGSIGLGQFLVNGGDATLRSYGLNSHDLAGLKPNELEAALRSAIPAEHLAFLDATRMSFSAGDYFFCHAGARPGVPLDRQSEQDLIWIRDEFLRSSHDFGKIIVHGHTPVEAPDIRPNGINIDTKAFASGVLTALVIEGSDRRFLFARA